MQLTALKLQLASKGVDIKNIFVYNDIANGRNTTLKLIIEENSNVDETEITIRCRGIDGDLSKLIETIRLFANTIPGKKDGVNFFIGLSDILYFETTDNRMFFYTENDFYETTLRLYEIEERFSETSFIRVSKSFIVNLSKVGNIRSETNGRLVAELVNGEKIVISRQYVPLIKKKLGL